MLRAAPSNMPPASLAWPRPRPRRAALSFALSCALGGCVTPPPPPKLPAAPTPPCPTQAEVRRFGRSVEGRPLWVFTRGRGDETVLLIASIHGSEPAGTPLLRALWRDDPELAQLCADRRVVLVPELNPDGVARGRRANSRKVDLNRNFPSRNFERRGAATEALSEPESAALARLIESLHPSRVLSIHQPLDCVDYDGPAEALARRIAARCALPVKKLGGRPGSLGSWLGDERGVPTITLELPRGAETWPQARLRSRFTPALKAFIRGD